MTKVVESFEFWKNLSLEDLPGEIWKDVIEFEGGYEISNFGRLKSLKRIAKTHNLYKDIERTYPERIIRAGLDSAGYPIVKLSAFGRMKRTSLHRLVTTAFIPNPENKPEVNHKNGIKTDARLENLEWVTNSENQKHAYKIGLQNANHVRGEESNWVKLTELQVIEIKILLSKKVTLKEIGKIYNVHFSTIWYIKTGKNWGWLKPSLEDCKNVDEL